MIKEDEKLSGEAASFFDMIHKELSVDPTIFY
jgi:hypothetical protein